MECCKQIPRMDRLCGSDECAKRDADVIAAEEAKLQPARDKAATISDTARVYIDRISTQQQQVAELQAGIATSERGLEAAIAGVMGIERVERGGRHCKHSPTKHCFYDPAKDQALDFCLMCGYPDERL